MRIKKRQHLYGNYTEDKQLLTFLESKHFGSTIHIVKMMI